jgi:hypothetical protein
MVVVNIMRWIDKGEPKMPDERGRIEIRVPLWELWVRDPLLHLVSLDEGKTWEGKYCEFFPFAPTPFSDIKIKHVNYVLSKKLISSRIKNKLQQEGI